MRRISIVPLGLFLVFSMAVPAHATRANSQFPSIAPNFACTDNSYQQAAKNGITLGISPDNPTTYLDPKSKQPTGIDWDINVAALQWAGIKTIHYQIMPFPSLIPALLSRRIDVIADDIHETPERNKVISFSGPGWWYGPSLIVQKGNPGKITSYADLKRSGVVVGVNTGSASDEYMTHLGIKPIEFAENTGEFLSVIQGKVTVILEDDPKYSAFLKQNPGANIQELNIPPPSDLIQTYGYSYARFGLRMADCTLNFAYSRALSELRDDGTIGAILQKWSLPLRDLYLPGV